MVSRFEDTLLRGGWLKRKLRRAFFDQLEEASLRSLRATSRSLHDLVDQSSAALLFMKLSVHTATMNKARAADLKRLAPLCRALTLGIGYFATLPTSGEMLTSKRFFRASFERQQLSSSAKQESEQSNRSSILPQVPRGPRSSMPHPARVSFRPARSTKAASALCPGDSKGLWISILSSFQNISSITFRVHGDPGWPGYTATEEMLVTLRIALETAAPAHLRTFTLAPIHAMGLIHLRWTRFAAFQSSPPASCRLWQRISTLDIRLQSLFVNSRLSASQQLMFTTTLHEYLRSFAPTLQSLRFIWLDGSGPSPLTLDLEDGMSGHSAIYWLQLEHLWLGNTALPRRSIRYASQHAPRLQSLKLLRPTEHDSSPDMDGDDAWMSIALSSEGTRAGPEEGEGEGDDGGDAASSIYSQSGSSARISAEGFGGTSRVVPFYLDIGERS